MKKTASALIILLLVSAMAGAFVVRLGKANPYYEETTEAYDPPSIYIDSPLNKTYNGKVLFNFTISPSEHWSAYEIVNTSDYSVDGKFAKTITINSRLLDPYTYSPEPFSYSIVLENLTDGIHVVRMFVKYTGYFYQHKGISDTWNRPELVTSAMANFTLDTVSPAVEIMSLGNKTYYESDLQLNFTVNENFYNASYVLDGQNVPVIENFTFSDLSVGSHSLIVYAYDYAGNIGASETIFFTVAEPFQTTLVIGFIIAVAIVGLGLLVYLKKRHPKLEVKG
jgi:hypothetical protein